MPENEDFCMSFELFSWVSDFLSLGVLEFFSGVHKKKPVLTSQNQSTFFQSNRNSKLEEKPVLSTSTQTLFYHLEVVPVISGVNGGGQNGYLSSWA